MKAAPLQRLLLSAREGQRALFMGLLLQRDDWRANAQVALEDCSYAGATQTRLLRNGHTLAVRVGPTFMSALHCVACRFKRNPFAIPFDCIGQQRQ